MGKPEIIKIEYASKRNKIGICLEPEGSEKCAKCFWKEREFDKRLTMDLSEPVYYALGVLVSTFSSLLGDPDESASPTADQVAWDGILMALNGASSKRMEVLEPHFEMVTKLGIKLAPPPVRFHLSLDPSDIAQLAQVAAVFRDALDKALKISILTPLFRQRGLTDFWSSLDLLARTLEAAAPKCYLRPVSLDSTVSEPAIYS